MGKGAGEKEGLKQTDGKEPISSEVLTPKLKQAAERKSRATEGLETKAHALGRNATRQTKPRRSLGRMEQLVLMELGEQLELMEQMKQNTGDWNQRKAERLMQLNGGPIL
jgi:hypothetical protein